MRVLLFTMTLLVASSGSSAWAQAEGEGDFAAIAFGETVQGFLTTSDDSLADGSYYKMFVFEGSEGDSVTIQLVSTSFNAVAIVVDSVGTFLNDDNDSGGNCNAHINTVLESSGRYIIYATSSSRDEVGPFQLALSNEATPPASSERCRGFLTWDGTLSAGDSVVGELSTSDGKLGESHYQVWRLDIPLGQAVTVDLISDAFDARLTLYEGFARAVAANDDGGGKCNARLHLTGSEHSYRVILTANPQGNPTGSYVLRVVDGSLPIVEESECEG